MTLAEAKALATIVKTNPTSSSFPEELLEIDEQLRLHVNRDAALLHVLASVVLHTAG